MSAMAHCTGAVVPVDLEVGAATHLSHDSTALACHQAVIQYLSPADLAASRQTCCQWRLVLSADITALQLPLNFLGTRNARQLLKRTAKVFPSLQHLTLCNSTGWCDPVQVGHDDTADHDVYSHVPPKCITPASMAASVASVALNCGIVYHDKAAPPCL